MIVKISQTNANFKNCFQISDENGVIFCADTPWIEMNLPFDVENLRKLNLTNLKGETVYTTDYSVIDNALEKAIPFKYLFADEQFFCKYSVIKDGKNVGSFYSRQDGFFDTKNCIEIDGRLIYCFAVSKGNFEVICFYENDRQIAQVTKSLTVVDNLDEYHLHITDDNATLLPVFSFFVIYYDYIHHRNGGEVVFAKTSVNWSYTINVNNKYYNPDWIAQEFGEETAEKLRRQIGMSRTGAKKKITKNIAIAFSIIGGVAILIFAVIILANALSQPKTPLNGMEFTEKMEEMGFDVGYVDNNTINAVSGDLEVEFHIMDSDDEAEAAFDEFKQDFNSKIGSSKSSRSMSNYYSLKTNGEYYFVTRVGHTLLTAETSDDFADEVSEVQKALGY